MENENVNLDTLNETENTTATVETSESIEDTESKPEFTESEKKLYARAKKAEAELKAYKAQKPVDAKAPPQNVEEVILQSQNVPDELIEELKLRASKYNGSLIRAQKDPNYIAVKERFEKDLKKKEASLPASRGAGAVRAQKSVTSPGLTRDEHMKLAKEIG